MDGLKNAETSSIDFYIQLITLKGYKKQFENLWADFWEKEKFDSESLNLTLNIFPKSAMELLIHLF